MFGYFDIGGSLVRTEKGEETEGVNPIDLNWFSILARPKGGG